MKYSIPKNKEMNWLNQYPDLFFLFCFLFLYIKIKIENTKKVGILICSAEIYITPPFFIPN